MPSDVRPASPDEAQLLLSRAARLLECRPAPLPGYPHMTVDWPAPPLAARLFLGGMQLPGAEHGQKDATIFDALLQQHSPSGIGIWSLRAHSNGVFIGRAPAADLRGWFVLERVLTPCVMLSLDADLIVVADDQLRYSVVGAPRSVIDSLDEQFGGMVALRQRLADAIAAGEIGFDAEDAEWARRCLLHWCFDSTVLSAARVPDCQ